MSEDQQQEAISDKVLGAFVDFYLKMGQTEELDLISQWDEQYLVAGINEILRLDSYFNHAEKKEFLIKEKRPELEKLITMLLDDHGAPNSSDVAQWTDWYRQHLDDLFSAARRSE